MRTSITNFRWAICVACAFVFLSFSLVQVIRPVDLILTNLDSYATNYSPSKIYLQTDRSIYALEDTVWFKAYTLDATYHYPTAASKVIYLDVLDSNGNKVTSKKLHAEKQGAASEFFIERDWSPGNYKIRAYTKFMLNQDQAYIFNKDIQIVDINKAYQELFTKPDSIGLQGLTESAASALDLKFFPESGDLVAGIDSRIAIKVENYATEFGSMTGTIEDESGNHVVPFKIFERGYGLAAFTPEAGKKYVAKLDNEPLVYPLPEVKATGYNITTHSKSDNVSFVISSNVESGLSGGDILIHSNGQLVHHEKLDDSVNKSYGLKLDTKEIPSGVAQITYFDGKAIPRAERLFFVDNSLTETVITTDKAIYSKRAKVDLNLFMQNDNQEIYDCSVSVYDNSNLKGARPSDNIKSWMLLNSDLRGEINDPAYYFEELGDRKRAYLLDLVLMTHGWRRFNWEDMSQKNAFKNLEHERELGIYVNGYTGKLLNNKTPTKSTVMLNFLGNTFSQEEIVTKDDGHFVFGPYVIEDSIAAIIQARKYDGAKKKDFAAGNKNLNINMDVHHYFNLKKPVFEEDEKYDYASYKDFINTNRHSQALKDNYYSMEVTLDEVVLTARRKQKTEEIDKIVSERGLYFTPSNRVVLEENDKSKYITIFDMLRDIPGVTVGGAPPNQRVVVRGLSTISLSNAPLLLIDGVPSDIDFLNSVNISDVYFVDVLKGAQASVYGSRGANGVIAVYTGANPDTNVITRRPGIIDIVIYGFDKNREFYSPDYSKNVSSVYEPDVRTTLYWNPNVRLSNGEESTLSFFTGDNTGEYIVTTEGLSQDGEPIFGTYEFSVQEKK